MGWRDLGALLLLFLITNAAGEESTSGCSYHADRDCHPLASCEEIEDPLENFRCVCPEGATGDGLVGETHTGCVYPACPEGFVGLSHYCYAFEREKRPFPDAQRLCWDHGGEIVSVHSQEELDFIKQQDVLYGYKGFYWLGYTDIKLDGKWIWQDGSISTYTNWAEGEPMTASETHNCGAVNMDDDNYSFSAKNCSDPLPTICKFDSLQKKCSVGWTEVDGDCYSVIEKPGSSYLDAYLTCTLNGGDLASIHSADVQAQVTQDLSLDEQYWIGENRDFLAPSEDGAMTWTDGSVRTNASFVAQYGNTSSEVLEGAEVCVAMDINGTWYKQQCHILLNGFVCKRQAGVMVNCIGDSIKFGESCYKVKYDKKLTSQDSRQFCIYMGGDLASIHNHNQQTFIQSIIQKKNVNESYFIGYREESDGAYHWTDDSADDYQSWASGKPSDQADKNCVKMEVNAEYNWADTSCTEDLPFVCQYTNTPCINSADCHATLGECYLGQCRCHKGYYGDGVTTCKDIDECYFDPCGEHGTCNNLEPLFECLCDEGYVWDGATCINARLCTSQLDCNKLALCNAEKLCECITGYEGDGKANCTDVNECVEGIHNCHADANCMNEEASFTCECKDGYDGDGYNCVRIPTSCQVILEMDPTAQDGLYMIDPDATGPIKGMMAYCEMRNGWGITILHHDLEQDIRVNGYSKEAFRRTLKYENDVTTPQMLELVARSKFCYQEAIYECKGVSILDYSSWKTGDGDRKSTVGGSITEGQCGCAMYDACAEEGAPCNCAETRVWRNDRGKILKDLPVQDVRLGGVEGADGLFITVGPLKCAEIQFDIPVDCQDARDNYGLQFNDVVLIDLDGPNGDDDGNLEPFYAHCDVETYTHVAITQIPHKSGQNGNIDGGRYITVNATGDMNIEYVVPQNVINKLLKVSPYCSQDIGYQCQDSGLLGATGGHWSSHDGTVRQYWGSSGEQEGMCACGVIDKCDQPGTNCNCNIKDGKQRQDFGVLTNKQHLPVGSVSVGELGQAAYYVGWLQCANRQFGVEPSCQWYRNNKHEYSYVMLIDPDGPLPSDATPEQIAADIAPFPAHCHFPNDVLLGITIIPAVPGEPGSGPGDGPGVGPGDGYIGINYPGTEKPGLEGLTDRSTYCTQDITYTCNKSPIHQDGANVVYWKSLSGARRDYFAGIAGDACTCNGNCTGGGLCHCDANQDGLEDAGELQKKQDLPVSRVYPQSGGSFTVGDLKCYEVWPTCHHQKVSYDPEDGQAPAIKNAFYAVDPDGVGGVPPFDVYCRNSETVLSPVANRAKTFESVFLDKPEDYAGKYKVCHTLKYNAASTEQLRALTEVSGFCSQYARYECRNAPLTNNSVWRNREGEDMQGWAGNLGGSECACGELNRCDGGLDAACNCDSNDDVLRMDEGVLIDKQYLPISEVCMGYDERPGADRMVGYKVEALSCRPVQGGIVIDCQRWREQSKITDSGAWIVDPDGAYGRDPYLAYCEMVVDPPLGITTNTPKDESCLSAEQPLTVEYNRASIDVLVGMIDHSTYCYQDIMYKCTGKALSLDVLQGWYDRAGTLVSFQDSNIDAADCPNGVCACDGANGDYTRIRLWNKEKLPITKLTMPASNANCVKVNPLKCFTVYKDCEEIRDKNQKRFNPLGIHRYAIDPDAANGVEWFGVDCDFSNPFNGITVVPHDQGSSNIVTPNDKDYVLGYKNATIEQLRALITISMWCKQDVSYQCAMTPLLNSPASPYAQLVDFTGAAMNSWAGADGTDFDGCACNVLDTCPQNHTCRCDALGESSEDGMLMSDEVLPVSGYNLGGELQDNSLASLLVGPLQCSQKYYSLPSNCEELRKQGKESGEYVILPFGTVEPFLVYCDMHTWGTGVTIIREDIASSLPTNEEVTITYKQVIHEQIVALKMYASSFCYQPIKVSCSNSQFLGSNPGENRWNTHQQYLGDNGERKFCTCGEERLCGGRDGEAAMKERLCNCDVNDGEVRHDAAILPIKAHLPVYDVSFLSLGTNGTVTVGDLYCANIELAFDECAMGFHDCHQHADCLNTHEGFECHCQQGYQGKGVPGAWANGRQCVDDDECALNMCPENSDCTNLDGSYDCQCYDGLRYVDGDCVDIDECIDEEDNNCDGNARCINTWRGFMCACNPGYTGTGVDGDCTEFGICSCWGDPHCESFDHKFMHFQGPCSYVMARDGCTDGFPSGEPSYTIIQKNWRGYQGNRNQDVSWTKELQVVLYGRTITLAQELKVYIDGVRISKLPASPIPDHPEVTLTMSGLYVSLKTGLDVEVRWSGSTKAEVLVSQESKSKLCGLCGNYNNDPEDDWIVGPECPESGKTTDNYVAFGHSWYADPEGSVCPKDCDAETPPECTGSKKEEAEEQCGLLTSLVGRFQECMALMDDQNAETRVQLQESCVYDMCATDGDISAALCEAAQDIATRCQDDYSVNIHAWRSDNFCPMQCGEGMVYSPCANPKQPTCLDQTVSAYSPSQCREGCVCETGLIMDGDICVHPEKCGCELEGLYYSIGDYLVRPNCSAECICDTMMSPMNCTALACHEEATCLSDDGVLDCYCNSGYKGDGRDNCEDINECLDGSPCGDNAICTNTVGAYTCACKDGYRMDDKQKCKDIDECVEGTAPCDENSDCVNLPGSFKCNCHEGFAWNKNSKICEDVNECLDGRNECDRGSTECMNKPGSYQCDCKEGFKREDNHTCTDINECSDDALNDCDKAHGECYNNIGGFSCGCINGYTGDGGKTCADINECEGINDCDENAACKNTDGTYECTCNTRFEGDGFTCTDKQCDKSCDDNQHCDFVGETEAMICSCNLGYKPSADNADSCVDVNECDASSESSTQRCDPNALCENTVGSFKCTCKTGFTGNGKQCRDIDECADGTDDCDKNAACINTAGSYSCECHDGYTGDGQTCTNINECELKLDNCQDNAICEDTDGGYRCKCMMGYTGHCDACEDVDECVTGLAECDKNAKCENTEGSYICRCNDGYMGQGRLCVDKDECELGLAVYPANSKCVNYPGGYRFICCTGYKLTEDKTCEDINECQTSSNLCDPNAECINNLGSYSCRCKYGYSDVNGDGTLCQENDPGLCGGITCHQFATCKEESDVKKCTCVDGYEGLGQGEAGCTVVDPCSQRDCGSNAECLSSAGKAVCMCNEGFIMKNGLCEEEKVDPCEAADACGIGSTCVHDEKSSGHTCSCAAGYLSDGYDCHDINECSISTDTLCGQNMQCINLEGGYRCDCKAGYEQDQKGDCKDIDECDSGSNNCAVDDRADCFNTPGDYNCVCIAPFQGDGYECKLPASVEECSASCPENQHCEIITDTQYRCQCNDGFEAKLNFDGNSFVCEDIRECDGSPCHAHAECEEQVPGYQCTCAPGYTGNGHVCEDVDECVDGNNDCHKEADCINTDGSFHCICSRGYRGDGKIQCNAINPDEDPCGCGPGGVCDCQTDVCTCDEGYTLDNSLSNYKCIDVNECSNSSPCHPLAACTNTVGSFTCTCPEGTVGDGNNYCDDDECSAGTVHEYCDPNAACENSIGAYTCTCKEGFSGDGKTCTDNSDPCSSTDCGANAICRNEDSQAFCTCMAGYAGDGTACVDINECLYANDCHVNATCSNRAGSYTCACKQGFSGNGKDCMDIDECRDGEHNCSPDAQCTNTIGGFTCGPCNTGFEGDGFECTLVTPCAAGCGENAVCQSLPSGAYACQCEEGYSGDGQTCADVDECAGSPCDDNARCDNLPGEYKCTCNGGYEGNGFYCYDVNECQLDVCKENMECTNQPGSFLCTCNTGYKTSADGGCEDEDECASGDASCPANSHCVNTPGGYTCQCEDNFTCTGTQCLAVVVCTLSDPSSCSVGTCVQKDGTNQCQCSLGSAVIDGKCKEVDECSLPPQSPLAANCINARCIDKPQGFTCQCNDGYERVSDTECRDIDECQQQAGLCGEYGECINTGGDYHCQCRVGYEWNGETCADRNECTDRADVCGDVDSAICTNVQGSYTCSCRQGFRRHLAKCIDIDECQEDSSLCNNTEASCVNTRGAFICGCPQGYYLNNDKCKNINECEDGPCDVNGVCEDNDGSYTCTCQHGYTGNGKICIAVCQSGVCPPRQTCSVSDDGQAQCSCRNDDSACTKRGKVCGTDGNTYDNEAQMRMFACTTNQDIQKAYSGTCQESCETVPEHPYKQCVIDENDRPTLECKPCEEGEDDKNELVCTEKFGIFQNMCMFKMSMCAKDVEEIIETEPVDTCNFDPKNCQYKPWKEWSACSVSCGMGERTHTRSPRYVGFKDICTDTTQTGECYGGEACPADPCENVACTHPAEYCRVNKKGTAGSCVCPTCADEPDDPVCGFIDSLLSTYANECQMRKAACEDGVPYGLVHPGKCTDGDNLPLNCSVLPLMASITQENGCVSMGDVQVNRCAGGCGTHTGLCCQPDKHVQQDQLFVCDGETQTDMVTSIQSCACVEDVRPPE